MKAETKITGRHVLLSLIGFFAVIASANAVFIHYALTSFPGEREEKSYLQGMNFNDRIADRAAQRALGWSVAIEEASLREGEALLRLRVEGADGEALRALNITGALMRPTSAVQDRVLTFTPSPDGRYVAVAAAGTGVWLLEGTVKDIDGHRFDFASRIRF